MTLPRLSRGAVEQFHGTVTAKAMTLLRDTTPPQTRPRSLVFCPTPGPIRRPNQPLERHKTPAPVNPIAVHHQAHVTRPNRTPTTRFHPPTPHRAAHPTRPNRPPHLHHRPQKSTPPSRLPNRPHPRPIPLELKPQDFHAPHLISSCQQLVAFSGSKVLQAGVLCLARGKNFSPDPSPPRPGTRA